MTQDLTRLPPGTIVPISDPSIAPMVVMTPESEITAATRIATQLARIIEKQKLYKQIGNKKHVYVEAWTAIAALRGCTPREVSNERQEDGSYIAVVELVNSRDHVLGIASAECGGPEEMLWHKRAPYARRSMAATRATSKVCRLCFAWIMVLAGYAGTPAEEMDGVAPQTPLDPAAKGSNQAPAASGAPWDGNLPVTFGKYKAGAKEGGPDGKKWNETPSAYLAWLLSNSDNETIKDMAAKEVGRRAKAESSVAQSPSEDLPFEGPPTPDDDDRYGHGP